MVLHLVASDVLFALCTISATYSLGQRAEHRSFFLAVFSGFRVQQSLSWFEASELRDAPSSRRTACVRQTAPSLASVQLGSLSLRTFGLIGLSAHRLQQLPCSCMLSESSGAPSSSTTARNRRIATSPVCMSQSSLEISPALLQLSLRSYVISALRWQQPSCCWVARALLACASAAGAQSSVRAPRKLLFTSHRG